MRPVSRLAITITYSECVENHVGMQKLGNKAKRGFTLKELEDGKQQFEALGAICELLHLNDALASSEHKAGGVPDAYVLIVRGGVDHLLRDEEKDKHHVKSDMLKELLAFEWDTKAIMRKKLVNKHARHNVCFGDAYQAPDLANGKGTIVAFKDVPCTRTIREKLFAVMGENAKDLLAEGNKYNDVTKNGIGFHGDSERSLVIGARIGHSFPLHYQWYHRFEPAGEPIKINLNDGDMYVMSDKSVGRDWHLSSILTLRHAAGGPKYLQTNSHKQKRKSVQTKLQPTKRQKTETLLVPHPGMNYATLPFEF